MTPDEGARRDDAIEMMRSEEPEGRSRSVLATPSGIIVAGRGDSYEEVDRVEKAKWLTASPMPGSPLKGFHRALDVFRAGPRRTAGP